MTEILDIAQEEKLNFIRDINRRSEELIANFNSNKTATIDENYSKFLSDLIKCFDDEYEDILSELITRGPHGAFNALYPFLNQGEDKKIFFLMSIIRKDYEKETSMYEKISKKMKEIINDGFDEGKGFLVLGEALSKSGNRDTKDLINDDLDTGIDFPTVGETLENLSRSDILNIINIYKKAISLDSHSYKGYFSLGVLYSKIKDLDNAKACYEKVIKLKPNYSDAYINLSTVYLQKSLGGQATEILENSLKFKSRLVYKYFMLGKLYYHGKKIDKAIEYLELSISEEQKYFEEIEYKYYARLTLAHIYKSIKNYEKAKEHQDILDKMHIKRIGTQLIVMQN